MLFRSVPHHGLEQPLHRLAQADRVAVLEINQRMSEADPNGMNITSPRIHVSAGPQRVSAAFIQRFDGPADDAGLHAAYRQCAFTVYDTQNRVVERYETKIEGRGMQYQAIEAEECIRAGKLESDIMPLDETVSILATMDDIRAQIGVRFPNE